MQPVIACVLRSGGEYKPEHVLRLKGQVERHLRLAHRFVCLSDVWLPCETVPLETDWPGWWAKIELFRRDIFGGPVLFLDLDTTIVGSLDDLVLAPHRFTMLSDFYFLEKPASGLMAWSGDWSKLYETFAADPDGYRRRHRGDQEFIAAHLGFNPDRWQDLFPGEVVSYKVHCKSGVPSGAKVVCYHGTPKPWDVER